MFYFYNTLTHQKEPLEPVTPGKLTIYLCGPTVYDACHIGHARSWVIFDMMVRYWRSMGYDVTYVRNITDIEDKIIKRAQEKGWEWQQLTEYYTDAFQRNAEQLGTLKPDVEPKATEHIKQIIELIQTLQKEEFAYVTDNQNVCFDVRRFKDYGKLSGHSIDDLIAGARIDVNTDKNDPLDFVLWKPAKPNEPSWPSPWGDGRPGWHIECSAMSEHYLGQPFDIHGGGMDLKFPHNENEIAQSEAAHKKTFAKMWAHVGLVQINQEKMAKSLGNFHTIDEVLAKYPAETIRYFLLSSHYRSPVNYSDDHLQQAHRALQRLYTACRGLNYDINNNVEIPTAFVDAMHDDFNTPEAFAVLFDIAHDINQHKDQGDTTTAAEKAGLLCRLGQYFGILLQEPTVFLQQPIGEQKEDEATVNSLIKQRETARANKDWGLSDQIRDQLVAMGIILEDNAGQTTWRRR